MNDMLTVRLDPLSFKALYRIARETGFTASDVVRHAILTLADNPDRWPEFMPNCVRDEFVHAIKKQGFDNIKAWAYHMEVNPMTVYQVLATIDQGIRPGSGHKNAPTVSARIFEHIQDVLDRNIEGLVDR